MNVAGNPVAEGQWFRFKQGTPMPGGLSKLGQMVFNAILNYGMVILDCSDGSNFGFGGEGTPTNGTDPLTAAGIPNMQAFPWTSLEQINPTAINWL
jgi:hypothetical protein